MRTLSPTQLSAISLALSIARSELISRLEVLSSATGSEATQHAINETIAEMDDAFARIADLSRTARRSATT